MTVKRRTDEAQFDPSSGHFEVVTPDDAADLPFVTRRVEVGVSGTLAVVSETGQDVTLPAMPDGHVFNMRVTKILATGTTADNIVAFY